MITNQCKICSHQKVCYVYHFAKDIHIAKVTLEDCNKFSEVKTKGVSGNEGNVSTKQKKSRTIQEILETSDKLNNILKSNESREEKNSVVCANCGTATDKIYVCHDCGRQCCDLCSVEANTLASGQDNRPEHICDDCWSK